MNDIFIVGVGMTPFGVHADKSTARSEERRVGKEC